MRLAVVAALGAAAIAAVGGAGLGWRLAPGSTDIPTRLVLATVPTGPPVYVLPACAIAPQPAFRPLPPTPADSGTPPAQQTAGRVPPGFAPVRAVRCTDSWDTGAFTVTSSQTSTAADLQAVLAALKPPLIPEPAGPVLACPAIGVVPLAIALVDAQGTAVRVDLPRDLCGLYADASLRTLDTAHWTVTATTKAPLPS